MTFRSFAPALALLVLATGCDGDDDDDDDDVGGAVQVLTGKVDAELYVAMVADDSDIVLYACDGTADAVTVTEWFQGSHDGGRFDIASTRTSARADGDFDALAGTGTLHLEGATLDFALEAAEGDAGLYFDEVTNGDAEHWAGWIVLPDGSVRGSVLNRKTGGVVAGGDATPSAQVTVGGLRFRVQRLQAPVL